jgi:hypothetical protein
VYHGRVLVVGVSGAEVVGVGDAEARAGGRIEDLVVEDVVVGDEGAEEEVPDEVVAEVEIGSKIAHVVQGLYEIEFQQLDSLHHQHRH